MDCRDWVTVTRPCISLCASAIVTGTRCRGWRVRATRLRHSASPRFSGGPFILAAVRRGILGGTFDPPHLAHLFAGESAYSELGLDVVTFVPAGAPWQKADRVVAASVHRWEMTRLAVEPIEYFDAHDLEVVRDGWTYTADTLVEFGADDLVLILGSDAAAGLPTWHRPDRVLEMAEIAVVPRPGAPRSAVDAAVTEYHWLDGPELDISSTMLRSRVASGESIRFLVPEPVRSYISGRGLYRRDQSAPGAEPDPPI